MPSNPRFFEYLHGNIGLPTNPGQEAEGYFECPECYAVSKTAIVREGKAFWTCKNGHENVDMVQR